MDRIENITAMKKLAYGLRESSETLGVSVPFLRLEIGRGRLRVARLGRRVVIAASELERYLHAGMEAPRATAMQADRADRTPGSIFGGGA